MWKIQKRNVKFCHRTSQLTSFIKWFFQIRGQFIGKLFWHNCSWLKRSQTTEDINLVAQTLTGGSPAYNKCVSYKTRWSIIQYCFLKFSCIFWDKAWQSFRATTHLNLNTVGILMRAGLTYFIFYVSHESYLIVWGT